ncbi:MAG: UDP-N-acetylenolpyruvoylglucosamine reductase, partial [Spirochaetales bacterium]
MRILDEIVKNIKKSQKFCGDILFDVPMNEHTTFKIGGNADVLAFPNDEKSLMFLLSTLEENNVPFFILGGGSNIVVADQGIAGFVISTSALSSIKIIP